MTRRQQNEQLDAADAEAFPEDGVLLYDKSGREYRTSSRQEYTSLVFGQGYSVDKPKDPEPEPEVPIT